MVSSKVLKKLPSRGRVGTEPHRAKVLGGAACLPQPPRTEITTEKQYHLNHCLAH